MELTKLSRNELIKICKDRGLCGYSSKKKDEIIKLLDGCNIKNISPLRYPGGKTRAINILETYINKYYKDRTILISPFFGGGSFELYMKINNYKIIANDLFEPLYVFWNIMDTNRDELINKIKSKMPITKEKFKLLKDNICDEADLIEKAASYFIINRTSFSGSTLSGGYSKEAAEHRLTDSSIERLKNCNIKNIKFSNLDCIEFLNKNPDTDKTIIYADPPYYIDKYIYGKDGNMHEGFNHELFAKYIKQRNNWIISYNDCEYIRKLYEGCRIFQESWAYGMNKTKKSSEIIILPPS